MNYLNKKILNTATWLLIFTFQFIKIYLILFKGIECVTFILLLSSIEFLIITSFVLLKFKQEFIFQFLFIFTFFFYFYNHVYPIIYFLIINISIFDEFGDAHIYNALVLSTITFSIFVQFTFAETKSFYLKKYLNNTKFRNKIVFQKIKGFSKRKILFLILYGAFSILAFYYCFTYFTLPAAILSNRSEVLKILWAGPGVYIKAILIGVSAYIFVFLHNVFNIHTIKRSIKGLLLSLPVILFWIVHFLAGNRREAISLIIFISIYFVSIRQISLRKILIVATVFFSIMTLISKARGGSEQTEKSLYLNSFGEFIFPYNTLVETMRKDMAFEDYRLGSTYLFPFYALIPRAAWEKKPFPIATQFSRDMKKGFGLGFSPLTEAYMNWGKFSVLILPIIMLLLYIFFLKYDGKLPCLFIFLLMNSLNLNRGELGTVLFEIFLMYFPFYLLYFSSKQLIINR